MKFQLVMSTIGRPDDLRSFMKALEEQAADVMLCITDQSDEGTARRVVAEEWSFPTDYRWTPSVRGLSRGRNEWLSTVSGDIIAFPDDDCRYPPGLLKSVADAFLCMPWIDILSVRQVTPDGSDSMLRWRSREGRISAWGVPRTVNSSTLFMRRSVVQGVGGFDVHLGVGAGTPCGAGEENDFVLRALKIGAVAWYRPTLVVTQADWRVGLELDEIADKARRYNHGFGCCLRKHRRYVDLIYWVGRAAAGLAIACARRDGRSVALQGANLRGRVGGWAHG